MQYMKGESLVNNWNCIRTTDLRLFQKCYFYINQKIYLMCIDTRKERTTFTCQSYHIVDSISRSFGKRKEVERFDDAHRLDFSCRSIQ